MSLSKEPPTVDAAAATAAAEQPRRPKCSRCRHHGIIVPQKGHMKYCPFLDCVCWKCYLITQRTRITTHLNKAESKEQRPCARPGREKPATEGTHSAPALEGGARQSATSRAMCPPSEGPPERADTTPAKSPLDLRSKPAAGGQSVSGVDSRDILPIAPNAPYFEFGQAAPLPVSHFPFRMSGHFPSGLAAYPKYLLNTPWLAPVPAGLCGPLMFPHFRSGAAYYPPQPEPGPPALSTSPTPRGRPGRAERRGALKQLYYSS